MKTENKERGRAIEMNVVSRVGKGGKG